MKLEVKHFLVQIIESFAVFDQTGEGFLPIAQLKHLMCTNFGKASWDIIYTFYLIFRLRIRNFERRGL